MITVTETLSIVDSKNNFIQEYKEANKIQLVSKRLRNCYCIVTNSTYNNVLVPIVGGQINESTKFIFVEDNCTEKDLLDVIRDLYEKFDSDRLNILFFNIEHIQIVPDIQTKFVLKSKNSNKISNNKFKSTIDAKLYDYRNEINYSMENRITMECRNIISGRNLEDVFQSSVANSISKYL